MAKQAKLGSGSRFQKVERAAAASGARNPAAVAAAAGIKKYGKERMKQMAQAGKKAGGGCCTGVANQADINHPSSNAQIIPPGMVQQDTYYH